MEKICVVMLFIFAFTACAQEPTAAPQAQDGSAGVNVSLTEFTIEITTEVVPVGAVRFVITNNGSIEHNLYIEPAGAIRDPLSDPEGHPATLEGIQAGETVFLDYMFATGGEVYQLGCHLPGHYEAGMVEVFTVGE